MEILPIVHRVMRRFFRVHRHPAYRIDDRAPCMTAAMIVIVPVIVAAMRF